MADTKKYIVQGTTIKHGRGTEAGKVYAHGDEIELTEEEAAPIKKHLTEAEAKTATGDGKGTKGKGK